MYIVLKHGEFSVDIFKDDDSLREFCMVQLEIYDEARNDVDYEGTEDLDMLITTTIYYGTKEVKNEGWGVVSIIKGNDLIEYDRNHKIEYK